MFELLGIFADFFYSQHGANFLQQIGQLLHKFGANAPRSFTTGAPMSAHSMRSSE